MREPDIQRKRVGIPSMQTQKIRVDRKEAEAKKTESRHKVGSLGYEHRKRRNREVVTKSETQTESVREAEREVVPGLVDRSGSRSCAL